MKPIKKPRKISVEINPNMSVECVDVLIKTLKSGPFILIRPDQTDCNKDINMYSMGVEGNSLVGILERSKFTVLNRDVNRKKE